MPEGVHRILRVSSSDPCPLQGTAKQSCWLARGFLEVRFPSTFYCKWVTDTIILGNQNRLSAGLAPRFCLGTPGDYLTIQGQDFDFYRFAADSETQFQYFSRTVAFKNVIFVQFFEVQRANWTSGAPKTSVWCKLGCNDKFTKGSEFLIFYGRLLVLLGNLVTAFLACTADSRMIWLTSHNCNLSQQPASGKNYGQEWALTPASRNKVKRW